MVWGRWREIEGAGALKGGRWSEMRQTEWKACAVILVVLVGKFSVWTESDEAGHKPPGWISEIKVPRSLLSHHIPYHQGGIHLLTQKDGATESGAGENRQKMESKSLSGGFVGIWSSWTLWGPVVLHRDDRHTAANLLYVYRLVWICCLSSLDKNKRRRCDNQKRYRRESKNQQMIRFEPQRQTFVSLQYKLRERIQNRWQTAFKTQYLSDI